ncbi:MAG: GIY-YIG nuclease family protein [Ignavibacteriota bacterium]|jgi:putative endonuclease|nr:MAG: GIY-YIG nuclease family protein [Chlorobiota bacterium]MBE7476476.1 GIY-YIG nuclease family protein [Ignavibacteriales bacterium]MBL1123611.1 GIY-YIG nuclease family protein [Ignavibacteriota bacterium]MBV6420772.1 hypothetical protein [Ignavibacteriaceae bacterium]MCE7855532.1 GIY-YIG nuclease family protein [Ignavibacteria bacterium CHB3]MEB2297045.1 GIY-YIG nuclease family protein [Ignavibacteria bacterium]
MKHFYIYVLQSEKDKKFYTGYTHNINKRFEQHNSGMVDSTKNRRPFKLIYWEGSLNKWDAINREKYLKSAWGKRYLKNRLKNYLTHEIKL